MELISQQANKNPNTLTQSTPPSSSRYENQKRRDWNTFCQYLRNHRPPLSPVVQRRTRARVPPLPRPVRENKGPPPKLRLLRPPKPSRALPLPSPTSLGFTRRPNRPPPCRLRGERWPSRG
ncbi:hypothetical protein Bca52824_055228 [Brassica carinata]|uniref:ALOG domain-containing protein n=1 Tax=Brassica carinata TaxID=52824 RepID=A0A8X7R9W9_BRACI|nr:hypothetical protein Bca52824_055228 [Brassica carinata]